MVQMMPRKTVDPQARLLLTLFAVGLSVASLYGAFFGLVIISFSGTTLGLVIGAAFLLGALAVFALCIIGATKFRVREVMLAFAIAFVLLVSHSAIIDTW